MADLDVQPKRPIPGLLWLVLALIALVVLFFLFKGCNAKKPDSGAADAAKTVALTTPDWNKVDFNAARSADPDVTDTAITVRGTEDYTIYTLGENILFASDDTALQGHAGDKLKQVAASLNKRFKGASIGVYGSADSTGTDGHNKQLGAGRAAAVLHWLTTTGRLDPAMISIHSLGESQPVASNATASGRQQNRNVAIVAFPKK